MKQPTVTPIRETGVVTATASGLLPNVERDLQWIDEVAALLPEESRLGWYRNVRPWLRMLPPDDEVAHLAYSMGYLALLTRSTPLIVAEERAKLTDLLHRHRDDVIGAVKATADYHQKLNDRLKKLPSEIAQGLSPKALATEIVGTTAARDLTGPDLRDAILALAAAAAAVSNDSGLLHVAAALGTPSIGIFGPTSAWHWAPLNPLAATIETTSELACRPCHKPVCRLVHHRCMRDIAPEVVLAATRQALARDRRGTLAGPPA